MVSSIGSSSVSSLMQRPDPSQMASKLFSKLDTKNQGYIEKSDLQSAFDQLSTSGNSSSTTSVDDVFSQLDTNSDGKVTKQEMTDSLKKIADQLDNQFNNMRTSSGGMPLRRRRVPIVQALPRMNYRASLMKSALPTASAPA